MMIGHDLERCFAEAVERGLGPCPSDVQQNVASLGYAHSVQGFRYPITWDVDVPDPETTITTATQLLRLVQYRVATLRSLA